MRNALRFILVLWLSFAPAAAHSEIQLPDMGSGSTAITPVEEERIGRDIVRQLRRAGNIVDDPGLTAYINDLGARLTSASGAGQQFSFFLLDDPTINAFALPGGFIGVNAGLILAARSESELASVVAHEIAHVTQQHIARRIEQMNRSNLPMTAALIAAIVLGSQNPELGQAAIASSLGAATQSQLDFSRAHEQEADRIGMHILSDAGFAPGAMASFFERLYQETRLAGGEASELEFLRTHPVTISRISDARNRAAEFDRQQAPAAATFEFIKLELRARLAADPSALARQLGVQLEAGAPSSLEATRYGYALALWRAGRIADAKAAMQRIDAPTEVQARILRVRAELELADGQYANAEVLLKKARDLYPGDEALCLAYTRLFAETRRHADAVATLRAFLRDYHTSPPLLNALAESEHGAGNPAAARLALAERFILLDEKNQAIEQLEMARREKGVDFYDLARVEARLQQLRDPASRR
ncbi:MAG: M48 family metalloprotease [Gammaproteobacteria bacterium]|nr:M48 family metalloprotease [Gammaproteobacteria bacterium]